MSRTLVKCTKQGFSNHYPALTCPDGHYVSAVCSGDSGTTCKRAGSDDSSYCIQCTELPRNVRLMNVSWKHEDSPAKLLTCEKDEIVTGMCLSGSNLDCCKGNQLDSNNNCIDGATRTSLACKTVKDARHMMTAMDTFNSPGSWCRKEIGCRGGSDASNIVNYKYNPGNSTSDTQNMEDVTSSDSLWTIAKCNPNAYMQGICKHADGLNCETVNFKNGSNVSPNGGMIHQNVQTMCHRFSEEANKKRDTSSQSTTSQETQKLMYGAIAFLALVIFVKMYQKPVV